MLVEYLFYIVTFIATAGLSVIGILTAYQLYHSGKQPAFLILLYQQIFLISFFTNSIWGNIVLREIISDIQISQALAVKLAIFIPVLGFPFLIVCWFMLLKFVFLISRKRYSDYRLLLVLLVIVSISILIVFLVHKGVIHTAGDPDLFIIRLFLITNFLIHLILFFAFRKSKRNYEEFNHVCFGFKQFLMYFSGVVIYTVLLSFFNVFGFISICFSILILFAVSISIPVLVKMYFRIQSVEAVENMQIVGFDEFCLQYEISKREAEIVKEICTGKSNKNIAETLFISLQTVKDHTHHIYTKTGVNSRMQLSNLVREKTGEAYK